MFKKMKLKPYLLTVFSIIIVLAAIITSIGTVGLLKTKDNMQVFIDKTLGAESAVKTCRIEANIAARDLREMVITDNPQDYAKLKERIGESIDTINEQISVFKQTHGETDGLAQKYEDAFEIWFNIATKAINQIEKGNKDAAKEIVLNECSPALNNLVEIVKEINTQIDEDKAASEDSAQKLIFTFIIISIISFMLVLIISLYFAMKTTTNITSTTNKVKEAVLELSKGNLKANIEYEAKNEFGELAERMNFSFQELSKYVDAIDYGMSEFSKGNFTCECPITFLGDFAHIQKSIENFQAKMNNTLVELDMASAQVSAGASQVADGAQALAQGATEQASSVEELSATIADISHQISQTAEYSEKANTLGKQAGEVVQKSQVEMKQMMKAIKDIASASENIQRIIKAIDDIAFQTNILALNAAVEAARAGNAGKGFAVVADEVRNLAQKSAEAAKDTTELIENSLQHVSHGELLAASTDAAFEEVAKYAEDILGMVAKIAQASNEQSLSISQISQGVDQISSVVQMNSATSEESAAASEELSGQAGVMKSLIDQFELSQTTGFVHDNGKSDANEVEVHSFDKY